VWLMAEQLYFIRCKISRGLFDSERQVTVRLPDGREFVTFVDMRNVKEDQPIDHEKTVDGWVEVFPVRVTSHQALVDLPQGSFTEGPRIEIPSRELRPSR
jgi:hypothetical protein